MHSYKKQVLFLLIKGLRIKIVKIQDNSFQKSCKTYDTIRMQNLIGS